MPAKSQTSFIPRSRLKVSRWKTLRLLYTRGRVVYPRFMRCLFGLASVCLLLPLAVEARDTGFINRKIAVNGGISKYVVYLPEEYTAKSKWPIILFLHGSGERGTDGLTE